MNRNRPLVLTILDGWGVSSNTEGNAIVAASTPNYDSLLRKYPNTVIQTSGPFVGLPSGQMGNSEVGHLNIGAGRIIHMDITRIDQMIESGEFYRNSTLLNSMRWAARGRLHLMGLLSDGGVHSMNTHLYALLRMAKREEVADVCVHCFTDGRDTPPESGVEFIRDLQAKLREIGLGRIASISGRYYSMDRDKRWDRIERAFRTMVTGDGGRASNPEDAVTRSYEHDVTDEFIEPVAMVSGGEPVGLIRDEDTCVFFNFRADRARQLTSAFTDATLASPPRSLAPKRLHFTTMTQYDKQLDLPHVISRQHPNNILANVFSASSMRNLRVAETEKYAHVTYFFNGGDERANIGEEHKLVASPKVATYDLMPEMSAGGITSVVVDAIESSEFDVVVMNFANADMVGHSGKLEPTVRAVEAVDGCLGEIYNALRRTSGAWIITADHGNAELMIDPITHSPHTYHTTNPVPFITVCSEPTFSLRGGGSLQDIAPTVLAMLGIEKPAEMTGVDLRIPTSAAMDK